MRRQQSPPGSERGPLPVVFSLGNTDRLPPYRRAAETSSLAIHRRPETIGTRFSQPSRQRGAPAPVLCHPAPVLRASLDCRQGFRSLVTIACEYTADRLATLVYAVPVLSPPRLLSMSRSPPIRCPRRETA